MATDLKIENNLGVNVYDSNFSKVKKNVKPLQMHPSLSLLKAQSHLHPFYAFEDAYILFPSSPNT